MKLLVCIALALTCVAAEYRCTPGRNFKIDCNTCFCSDDGKMLTCTQMACRPKGNSNVIRIDSVQNHKKQDCTPGTAYNDYCNVCSCLADGSAFACTMMYCDKSVWNKDGSIKLPAVTRKTRSVNKQMCTPGTSYKDYCNACSCLPDGSNYYCTMMFCDKDVWNKDGTLKNPPAIVQKPRSVNKQVCTPGTTFNDYCNVCTCFDDGSNFFCTMMYCDKTVWNKDGSHKYLTDLAENPQEGSSALARKSRSVNKQVCTPGTTFNDYCNVCTCFDDGSNFFCTMMYCDKTVWNKDGTIKYLTDLAQERQVTNEENWGPLYKEGDACTPGRAFYSECNRCVCTESGRSAFCTLMSCQRSP